MYLKILWYHVKFILKQDKCSGGREKNEVQILKGKILNFKLFSIHLNLTIPFLYLNSALIF